MVVTDHGAGDNTDFILSMTGFARMARPHMAKALMSYGVVDVEYQRVPCMYPGSNLKLKVHENSNYPNYLALVILYQGGEYDITAVELWQVDLILTTYVYVLTVSLHFIHFLDEDLKIVF